MFKGNWLTDKCISTDEIIVFIKHGRNSFASVESLVKIYCLP